MAAYRRRVGLSRQPLRFRAAALPAPRTVARRHQSAAVARNASSEAYVEAAYARLLVARSSALAAAPAGPPPRPTCRMPRDYPRLPGAAASRPTPGPASMSEPGSQPGAARGSRAGSAARATSATTMFSTTASFWASGRRAATSPNSGRPRATSPNSPGPPSPAEKRSSATGWGR